MTTAPALRVLPGGRAPDTPTDRLAHRRLVLDRLREHHRSTPPRSSSR